MEMDGRDKADLQRNLGTRSIVEELDRLRITFGFDDVQVLTPFVESKLRSGQMPQRQLKLAIVINKNTLSMLKGLAVSIEATFQVGFPSVPTAFEIISKSSDELGLDSLPTLLEHLTKKVKSFAETATESSAYALPVEVVHFAITEAKTLDVVFEEEMTTASDLNDSDIAQAHTATNMLPATMLANSVFQQPMNEFDSSSIFCCKMCGTELFDASMLNEHSAPENAKFSCSSYYLEEAPEWLDQSKTDSDKMYCKKCKARVGSWSWAGGRCGCKAWIVPAFQVIKSKVDPKQRIV